MQSSATKTSMMRKKKKKKELLPRHQWVIFSRGLIRLNLAWNLNLCHEHQAWVKLQLALHLLLLTILQLYHFPPPPLPPISNSSCLFTWCQLLYASCRIVLLSFPRDCTVKLKMSSLFLYLFFFMFYLCEKCMRAKLLQSCPTLCDPMDCSPPGSSVHGILQARILEWVAIPSSRGSSQCRDWTHVSYVSCIGRRISYH